MLAIAKAQEHVAPPPAPPSAPHADADALNNGVAYAAVTHPGVTHNAVPVGSICIAEIYNLPKAYFSGPLPHAPVSRPRLGRLSVCSSCTARQD